MQVNRPIMRTAVAALLVMNGLNAGAYQTDHEKALASLIDAERAFSRMSEDKGTREAFLTWLAPDAIVFRPAPVPAQPLYERMDPADMAVLSWDPEVAEISASGELGYTAGPYRIRPGRNAEPTDFGHYVSVWKKQADGAWRVFLDIGIPHGRQEPAPSDIRISPFRTDNPPLSPEALRDEEFAFGRLAGSFEKTAGSKGLRKALEEFAADDLRIFRPGRFPAMGKPGLKDIVPGEKGRISPGSRGGRSAYQILLAWSGDLAANYGTFETSKGHGPAVTTSYLRIWRKDRSGIWKISLDIELPVPVADGKNG
jgi:ketosteroid isomerase-like protein